MLQSHGVTDIMKRKIKIRKSHGLLPTQIEGGRKPKYSRKSKHKKDFVWGSAMKVYCCNCNKDIQARLTDGREVYPKRTDLYFLSFWKCDNCGGHVGCHKANRKPLGCIPSKEIKEARKHIHALIDPIWKSGRMSRKTIYRRLSEVLGREYHTADLRTIEEARVVYRAAKFLEKHWHPLKNLHDCHHEL